MAKILYISNNAINKNGRESPFLQQEKQWLINQFGAFKVICNRGVYICDSNGTISRVRKDGLFTRLICVLKSIADVNVYKELLHIALDHQFSIHNILKLYKYSYDAAILYSFIKYYRKDVNILYSFWFSYDAYACAMIKRKYHDIYAIARAHSYELQINRNSCNPYLMKKYTCNNLDEIAFISNNSLECFIDYYKGSTENFRIRYLGSTKNGTGMIERTQNERLVLVSCSSIVPVKRLDRLINAIKKWNNSRELHWIHVGDGPQAREIYRMALEYLDPNPHVTYEFLGYLDNNEVHNVLRRDSINLFVNVSDAEGVPVSIMEAMSVGLPVIAPRIFGIPELIDENCGFLFELDNAESNLLECLNKFIDLNKDERDQMGHNSYVKWKQKFCLEDNMLSMFSGRT